MISNNDLKLNDFDDLEDPKNPKKFLELVKKAYKQYKCHLYYEKFPLIYRKKVAEFESSGDIESKLETISSDLEFLLKSSNNLLTEIIPFLNTITYIPFPKKITSPLDGDDNFSIQLITNDRKSNEYFLDSYELFIDVNDTDSFIKLQIIGILWIYFIGVVLDDSLDPSCFGSRIKPEFKKQPKNSEYIFYRYFDKYTEWRDNGLNIANKLLEEKQRDALIISLDVTRFYYSVSIDFEAILNDYDQLIENKYQYLNQFVQKNRSLIKNLNFLLSQIHLKYCESIPKKIIAGIDTSIKCNDSPFLPIGLISSGIIANWYLHITDQEIIRQYNPDYYGRYVDDMLIVIKASDSVKNEIISYTSDDCRIFEILKNHFTIHHRVEESDKKSPNNRIFEYSLNDTGKILHINSFYKNKDGLIDARTPNLNIQIEKVRLYHLEKNSSQAVLNKLRKTINQNASFFRFLPDDEWEVTLDEVAYDIISKGSTHKIRNIVDISENDYELVKYLSSLSIKYKLCGIKKEEADIIIQQLFHFFNGINVIKYFKLWERIFSILLIFNRINDIKYFYHLCEKEIVKLNQKVLILDSLKEEEEYHNLIEKILSIKYNDKNNKNNETTTKRCFNEEIKSILRDSIEYSISYDFKNEKHIKDRFGELKYSNLDEFISKTSELIKNVLHIGDSSIESINEQLNLFLTKFFEKNKELYYHKNEKQTLIIIEVCNSLLESLNLSLSLSMGLSSLEIDNDMHPFFKNANKSKRKKIRDFITDRNIIKNSTSFRKSGLTRDQYLIYPLINQLLSEKKSLLDYKSFYSLSILSDGEKPQDNQIEDYPSRIYHLWEYLLLFHYVMLHQKRTSYRSISYENTIESRKYSLKQ